MAVAASCSGCKSTYRLDDDLAGQIVRCAECEKPIRVPGGVEKRRPKEIEEDENDDREKEPRDDDRETWGPGRVIGATAAGMLVVALLTAGVGFATGLTSPPGPERFAANVPADPPF